MNFTTFCDNKGCRKEMKPVVDKETLVAYCTECNGELSTITEFMRRQMMANGQVRKMKKTLAWSVLCPHCEKEGTPDLDDKDKLICSYCSEPVTHLSGPYAHSLRLNIKSTRGPS